MKDFLCIVFLGAFLIMATPAVQPIPVREIRRVVYVLDDDPFPTRRRQRRRNHYAGW